MLQILKLFCNFVAVMEDLLRSKKLSVTDFRVSVLEIFNRYSSAITSDQIESELGEFDRITLYRTLKTFKEKGVIHEIALTDTDTVYALCLDDCIEDEHIHHHEHVHFKCDNCGNVFCLDIPAYPDLNLKGFRVDRMDIQVFGKCEACSC
ncbi:MAG: transcriptional repressor [Crocinitomicaceae bacterium]|nr:transcriptional repressor [Crocinitomicaceae bacterium]